MTFNRWDVVAVDFPFVEGMEAKRRPGLIVSSSRLHQAHKLYWIAMISTAQAGERPDDIMVSNIETMGLSVDCAIRPARIATISESRIQRKIGTISTKDRNAVSAMLKKFVPA